MLCRLGFHRANRGPDTSAYGSFHAATGITPGSDFT